MDVIVFAGPSFPPADRLAASRVAFLGPASCGDIARATAAGARVIGLIDGLFETTLSPWHKEMLWAMSQGVRLFGAASMGALRAVELLPYGMAGVGEVFEAFRDGVIADDDEVAVLHGPAELGYVAVTEAMVNVRWTIAAAETAGVIDADAAAAVTRCAKLLFYKERTWPAIWEAARKEGVVPRVVASAAAWVREHRVDVKRRDANTLVGLLATIDVAGSELKGPTEFIGTTYWERMRSRLGIA